MYTWYMQKFLEIGDKIRGLRDIGLLVHVWDLIGLIPFAINPTQSVVAWGSIMYE